MHKPTFCHLFIHVSLSNHLIKPKKILSLQNKFEMSKFVIHAVYTDTGGGMIYHRVHS